MDMSLIPKPYASKAKTIFSCPRNATSAGSSDLHISPLRGLNCSKGKHYTSDVVRALTLV